MRNGQFDTFVLPQSFFEAAGGNVEVTADLFDTVVLDPDIDWRTEKERDDIQFFRGQSPTLGELTFKAPPGTLILTRPKRTIVPLPQQPAPAIGSQEPAAAAASTAGAISIVRWAQSGWIAIPSKQVGPLGQKAFINMRNDSPNVMGLSLHAFRHVAHADIRFTADRSDRIVLAEPACWMPAKPSDADNVPLATLEGIAPSVTVTGERPRARLRADLEHSTIVATSENGGFHYLQTDVRRRIDAVDLANALPDVLLVRPGNALPTNRLVRVSGDDDGDRVWLHPSYAWTIEHGNDGLIARAMMGQRRWQGFVFARGIRVALLPRPAFLTASALAGVPFYPGLADKVARRKNLRMIVSRGGYVRFSKNQQFHIRSIDLRNGAANGIIVDPGNISFRDQPLVISGDRSQDYVILRGFTAAAQPDGELPPYREYVMRDRSSKRIVTVRSYLPVNLLD